MSDELTELIVIRHGETVWNRDGLMQGHTDVELSGEGVAQAEELAERLAERLAGEDFAALISGDLKRAMQTARAIARLVIWPPVIHGGAALQAPRRCASGTSASWRV